MHMLIFDSDRDMLSFKEQPVENKPTYEAPKPTETLIEKTDSPPQGRVSVSCFQVFCIFFQVCILCYVSPLYLCQTIFFTLCYVILPVSTFLQFLSSLYSVYYCLFVVDFIVWLCLSVFKLIIICHIQANISFFVFYIHPTKDVYFYYFFLSNY